MVLLDQVAESLFVSQYMRTQEEKHKMKAKYSTAGGSTRRSGKLAGAAWSGLISVLILYVRTETATMCLAVAHSHSYLATPVSYTIARKHDLLSNLDSPFSHVYARKRPGLSGNYRNTVHFFSRAHWPSISPAGRKRQHSEFRAHRN